MATSPKYPLDPQHLAGLKALFKDPQSVSVDPSDLEAYGKDWTKIIPPAPSAIAFPHSTAEVSALLKFCSEQKIAVVPSGGRTGLSGGAVASKGEVVLSLSRMRRMDPIDLLAQTVRVQAGAVTEAVHDYSKVQGLTWPVDFASKGSSTVGGNIATNAGGVKVIRYGLTRHWVLGLQVVLMNGEVLELNGALEKNQTGLDLRQLFIGSEGTLGVVTEATLKLCRLPSEASLFFFSVPTMAKVLELFQAARSADFTLNAFEFVDRKCLEAVMSHRQLSCPFSETPEYSVLVEIEKPLVEDAQARLEAWLARVFDQALVADGTLAQSSTEAKNIWSLREGVSESLVAKTLLHKHDISVPICELEGFTKELISRLESAYRGYDVYLFGHIGDGNIHLNVGKPEKLSREAFIQSLPGIDAEIFPVVKKFHGSVSAEHGVGLLKKNALSFSRTPAELAIFRSVKKALDPQGLLNPGKIFDR